MQDDAEPPILSDQQSGPEAIPVSGDLIRPKRYPPRPPSEIEQARWFTAYRVNPRIGIAKLAALVKANKWRVQKAVREGWPEFNIPSFQSRVGPLPPKPDKVERVTTAVEQATIGQITRAVLGSWEDAARAQLVTLDRVMDSTAKLAEKLQKAVESANFTRYRRVPDVLPDGTIRRDKDGNPLMILRAHHDGHAVAQAIGRLATAQKDHAMIGKALLSSIPPPLPKTADDARDRDPRLMTSTERRARLDELLQRMALAGVEPDDKAADAG